MRVQKYVLVNHGDWQDGRITDRGKDKIETLCRYLARRVSGRSVVLLTSCADEAKGTAALLAERLGKIQFTEHAELLSGEGPISHDQRKRAISLLLSAARDAEVVIVTTHVQMVDQLPTWWGKMRGYRIPERFNTPRGTARVLHAETGWVEHIPPLPKA